MINRDGPGSVPTGSGGINYHCVVEEYTRTYQPLPREIFKDPDYDFNDDRIVIAGLGVVLPGAKNIEAFWDRLRDGKSMFRRSPNPVFIIATMQKRMIPITPFPW